MWKISIHFTKCAYVKFSLLRSRSINYSYSIGNNVIDQVKQIKDLGVIFRDNLNFNAHICEIVKKSLRMFGFMKRILHGFSDVTVYLTLYH